MSSAPEGISLLTWWKSLCQSSASLVPGSLEMVSGLSSVRTLSLKPEVKSLQFVGRWTASCPDSIMALTISHRLLCSPLLGTRLGTGFRRKEKIYKISQIWAGFELNWHNVRLWYQLRYPLHRLLKSSPFYLYSSKSHITMLQRPLIRNSCFSSV